MSDWRRLVGRGDLALLLWSVALGLAGAAVFGAYRAVSVSGESAGGRLAEFGTNLLWPGVLIFMAVTVVVWLGWKANLD